MLQESKLDVRWEHRSARKLWLQSTLFAKCEAFASGTLLIAKLEFAGA
jgi:hypothetical protein